jgi:hypothetical protein
MNVELRDTGSEDVNWVELSWLQKRSFFCDNGDESAGYIRTDDFFII